MNLEKFRENFEKRTDRNRIVLAERTVKSGRVIRFKESLGYEGEVTSIAGNVLSSNNRRVHNVHIELDPIRNDINKTECNCREAKYQHNTYICKHIAAVLIRYMELLSTKANEDNLSVADDNDIFTELNMLKANKDKIDLEVYLNHQADYLNNFIQAEFKIGKNRMYILKNLKEFINSRINESKVILGKNLEYDPKKDRFTDTDEKILDFIEEQVCNDNFTRSFDSGLVKGKYLNITENSYRRFFELLIDKEIIFNGEIVKVIGEDIPLKVNVSCNDDKYLINIIDDDIYPLNRKYDVCLFNGNIYIPSNAQKKNLCIFHKYIKDGRKLSLNKDNRNDIFNEIMPRIKKISANITEDPEVEKFERHELKSEFYLDIKRHKTIMEVKLIYGGDICYFNKADDKFILRDEDKEKIIFKKLSDLKFISKNISFVFEGSDDELYDFLTSKYKELEVLGDVYYSEAFKEKQRPIIPAIDAEIKESEDSYLDFTFNIENINSKEYKDILYAFKNNRRFYKLSDDTFLNLEEENTKAFFGMLEEIADRKKDNLQHIKVHKSRAVALKNYLEDENLNFIEGKEIVENIYSKIENIDSLDYEVPKNLNAVLRSYQVTGFKWFKTLSYLGLGGVLADEMGLGKTVQTISFLLSEEKKKSLIIAPMSLIYNWKNEFLKFAPSMKIGIVHGSRSERLNVINNLESYDVLLTTYGSIRNDEELYNDIKFDYCILDEGQNIKNPLSKTAKAVKSINAKNKFVLTGTPIENNLLELWSIFDFIMPGYLYSSFEFKKTFINQGNKNLKNQIRPFMLRRIKSDVIKELPEKIEKNHYVELNDEQKKIYSEYVDEVKAELSNPEFTHDKITIFSYLTKLRQICLDPAVIIDGYKGGSSKTKEALSIIKSSIEENHKILLFSQFTSVLHRIEEVLNKDNIDYLYLDGQTKAHERISLVDEFNNNENIKVFLISLKAGGTGLNLTSADTVIHFDPWYNPAIENQATDRAHRIGQKNVVKVFKLISLGTVEEKIITMQEEKKKLIESVIDDDYKSENVLSGLSKEELIDLFLD